MSSLSDSRPRVIATTDGEIDDRCSMIRFLMYANEWNIEGLIYCSSRFHWKGHDWSGTNWIEDQIDTYAEVYDNLKEHDPDYPSPDELRDLVYVGNIDDVGEMDKDTPGSDRIVEVLLDDDPGPVYLQAWGGTNTIARALEKIENKYPEQKEKVSEKAIIYIILNQDKTLREYIQPNWPELQIINSFKQFAVFAYEWDNLIPEEQRRYFEAEWMEENITTGHGPLCEAYPTADIEKDDLWEGVEHHFKEGQIFLSEGDTPSFMHQIRVGLGSLEHPSYGGWGGRFEREPGSRNVWIGAEDDGDLYKPIWRWVPDFQRDWAARADWCVQSYAEANHPPEIFVNDESGKDIVKIETEPDSTVELDATGTSDPDDDNLDFHWWNYREAEDLIGDPPSIEIKKPNSKRTTIKVPSEAGDREHHVILSVTDDGDPNLTRYRRVILDARK
ncbi:MAG: nucleoside hydrolase-like domain-containing protein [Halobacteriaceae archaeon]